MAFGAAILAPEGLSVTDWERAFFRDFRPYGFILFARNVDTPDQLRRLCANLRDAAGHDAPILVDQEGGRVQRLRGPHWREWLPPLEQMKQASDPIRALWLRYRIIAAELRDVGIDTNCAPCADIAGRETHPFLRNRCFGEDVLTVMDAARTVAEAHLAGGVLPVIKHIPGHGLAAADSHKTLPRVTATHDFLMREDYAPFRALADLPMGMTAHVVYDAIDADNPATTSRAMHYEIRQQIGFKGLLMSDDISMEALSGTVGARSRAAMAAGCDVVLHCNGKPRELLAVSEAVGTLSGTAEYWEAKGGLHLRKSSTPVDIDALSEEFDDLMTADP